MGFWSSIFNKALSEGEEAANDAIDNVFHGSANGDIVPAQNNAVAEMGEILDQFNRTKPHTPAEYFSTENLIIGIANQLKSYADRLNNARAFRGASEVLTLAKKINSDLEVERQTGVNPSGGTSAGAGGGYRLPGSDSPYLVPAAIVAGALLLPRLFGGRRRR